MTDVAAAVMDYGSADVQAFRPDLPVLFVRACLRAGDEDAAVAWLASIPPRHRPSSLATDLDFEALRDRADFRALFEPR